VARRPSVSDRVPLAEPGVGAGSDARRVPVPPPATIDPAAAWSREALLLEVPPREPADDPTGTGLGAAPASVPRRPGPGCPAGRPERGCRPDGPGWFGGAVRVAAAGFGRPGRPAPVVPDTGTADAGPPDEPDAAEPLPVPPQELGRPALPTTVPAFPLPPVRL